jgi:hypothetical protein
MKPLQHAKISAKKHGGKWEDYIDIHEFFDQTKAHIPNMRHRAILHNSLGIYIAQQVFGKVRTNSAGREYSVRDIGEDHVLEDLGTIPSMASIIECIDTKHLKWLGGLPKNKRTLVTKIPRKKPEEQTEEQPEEIIHEGACTTCGLEDGRHTQECSEKGKERPLETQEGLVCEECASTAPAGTHPSLMAHREDCPVLNRTEESPHSVLSDSDMVVDDAAFFRSTLMRD